MNNVVSKEDFVEMFLWNQKQVKIRNARVLEQNLKGYTCERNFIQNKGKQSSFRRRSVNCDR